MAGYQFPADESFYAKYTALTVYAPSGIRPGENDISSGGVERGVHVAGSILRDVVVLPRMPDVTPLSATLRNLQTGEEWPVKVTPRYIDDLLLPNYEAITVDIIEPELEHIPLTIDTASTTADMDRILRSGLVAPRALVYDWTAENMPEVVEGETYEIYMPVLMDSLYVYIRRTYVVIHPVESTIYRLSDILDLLEADTYVIPRSGESGYLLHFVRRGTGDYITGEIILTQELFDLEGFRINDASTFVGRAISR